MEGRETMAILYKDKELDGLYDEYDTSYAKEKGDKGERIISNELVKQLSEQYRILNSVYVRTDDCDFTEVDHIVIHDKFILCIETKNISGNLRPIDEETWEKMNFNGETLRIDSPQQQSLHHALSLRQFLKDHGIPAYVFSVVVLVNPKICTFDHEADTFYPNKCPVIFKQDLVPLIQYIEKQCDGIPNLPVQQVLDYILDEHEGIKNSPLFWCKKLAMNEGDPEAQYQLGKMYMTGYFDDGERLLKVKQNERAALYWYSRAKKQGHPLAKKELQLYYKNNR
jgi:hypothetical protein